METKNATTSITTPAVLITPSEFLAHWQGHRGLTRKVIEAFPEHELFHYSIGGMRTFAGLAIELLTLSAPTVEGIVTRQWKSFDEVEKSFNPSTREELLALWDEATEKLNAMFPLIEPHRFHETENVFNMYDGPVYSSLLYFVDNENHHRGQGYVYLRSLGITPPAFWDRNSA